MDTAGLTLAAASLAATIDHIQEISNATPTTLVLIRSQVKRLQEDLEHIQEWQHYTDPPGQSHVVSGLRITLDVANNCVLRLQEHLDSTGQEKYADPKRLGRAGSENLADAAFVFNEASLKQRLADIRECVALTHLTLSICHLPVGQNAQQQSSELVSGAQTLQKIHAQSGHERKRIAKAELLSDDHYRSSEFDAFVTSVQAAEAILGEANPCDSPVSHQDEATWLRSISITQSNETGRDELFLPREGFQRQQSLPSDRFPPPVPAKDRLPTHAGPALPPKVSESSTTYTKPDTLQRQISRKPINQRMSTYAESVLSDATIEATPIGDNTPGEFGLSRGDSKLLQRSGTTTTTLLSQASRSLNSLAENFSATTMNQHEMPFESPPPYVDPGTRPLARNVKRRDTADSTEMNGARPSLIQLVRDGDVDQILSMLEHGVNIDDADLVSNRTAIMEATFLRREKVTRILANAGSRLHLKDAEGNTALHFAARNGDANSCVLLLDAGSQLNDPNREGDTPMDLAARGGHTEAVTCLLNSWLVQNGQATTLLKGFIEATRSGNASTAQAFIERGIQPKKMKESWKPVIYAASTGSIPMMDLMLAQKCNVKAKCPDGWTALHYAAQAGHTPMVEKLLAWEMSWGAQTSKLGETALHLAILAGQSATAMALINHKGANITIKDNDNHQPIHHAVRNGDISLTAALLNKGAKLDVQSNYGWTPMLLASAYGHLPLVAEFITRGVSVEDKLQEPSAKPNKKTNEAARKGYWCEIRWPHSGARPIHLALEFGNDDVTRTLIASGAKVNEADSKGWKPLHYAAWNCRLQMVELLIGKSASPHATTDCGMSPLNIGFREHGLVASVDEKQQVHDILRAAMDANKKSKLKKLSGIMGSAKTKDVDERNKAWHTAELAAALYLSGQLEDTESDTYSQLAPSNSSHHRHDSKGQEDSTPTPPPQASSSRLTKRMTD